MKKYIDVTASFDRPELVVIIAEHLASRHYSSGYGDANIPGQWLSIETSGVETYVTGNMEIKDDSNNAVMIPFITCFLFTCTKEKSDAYKLDWSISLS